MSPAIVVIATKEPGVDNLVPDWDTLTVIPDQRDACTYQPREVGDIFAVWDVDWSMSLEAARLHARKEFPSIIWMWSPGGRVPVHLRHISWDNR